MDTSIKVTPQDLANAAIHSVWLTPAGYYGPGIWRRVKKDKNRDFILKLGDLQRVLMYFVVSSKPAHPEPATIFYGLAASTKKTRYININQPFEAQDRPRSRIPLDKPAGWGRLG